MYICLYVTSVPCAPQRPCSHPPISAHPLKSRKLLPLLLSHAVETSTRAKRKTGTLALFSHLHRPLLPPPACLCSAFGPPTLLFLCLFLHPFVSRHQLPIAKIQTAPLVVRSRQCPLYEQAPGSPGHVVAASPKMQHDLFFALSVLSLSVLLSAVLAPVGVSSLHTSDTGVPCRLSVDLRATLSHRLQARLSPLLPPVSPFPTSLDSLFSHTLPQCP